MYAVFCSRFTKIKTFQRLKAELMGKGLVIKGLMFHGL